LVRRTPSLGYRRRPPPDLLPLRDLLDPDDRWKLLVRSEPRWRAW
jgi:hypothetical protein